MHDLLRSYARQLPDAVSGERAEDRTAQATESGQYGEAPGVRLRFRLNTPSPWLEDYQPSSPGRSGRRRLLAPAGSDSSRPPPLRQELSRRTDPTAHRRAESRKYARYGREFAFTYPMMALSSVMTAAHAGPAAR
jgi:hypothetical protein